MKYVIIDTSSILFGLANRKSAIDAVRSELGERVLVSKGIISELSSISTRKGTRGAEAKAALWELSLKKIKIEANSKYPDLWIKQSVANPEIAAVVTNDTKLASAIKSKILVFKLFREGRLRKFR